MDSNSGPFELRFVGLTALSPISRGHVLEGLSVLDSIDESFMIAAALTGARRFQESAHKAYI